MKKVITGWTYQDEKFEFEKLNILSAYEFPDIFPSKGTKDTWEIGDWPPVKVKITFEWEGKKSWKKK